MMVHEITQAVGAHKRRKRVGRGESSGHGKTSGRGNKGMQARSGGGPHPMHEGGAIPLYRRLPKRGFSNFAFRRAYAPVNLFDLERYCQSGDKVDPAALRSHGLNGHDLPVKILGNGQLTKKLHVTAHAVSGAAKAAIEQAGGSVTVIEARDAKALWKAKRGKMKNQKRPAAGPSRIEKKKTQSGARAR